MHASTPMGSQVAICGRGTPDGDGAHSLVIWRLDVGQPQKMWQVPGDAINAVVFSADGQLVLAGGAFGGKADGIRAFDAITGDLKEEGFTHPGVQQLALSPDGTLLASASAYGHVKVFDVNTGEALAELKDHSKSVKGVAFSPDGTLLASCAHDGTVKIWNVARNLPNVGVAEPDAPKMDRTTSPLPGLIPQPQEASGVDRWQIETTRPRTKIRSLDWSLDGSRIACGMQDGTIRVYDTTDWNLVGFMAAHNGAVTSVAWQPNGRYLASCSDDDRGGKGEDRCVRLWDAAGTPGPTLDSQNGVPTDMVWSPDGQWLAVGSGNTVQLWNSNGNAGPVLAGHRDNVQSISWNPTGGALAALARDKTIRLWAADGTLQRVIKDVGDAKVLAWNPDGSQFATVDKDSHVQLWTPDGTCKESFEVRSLCLTMQWSPDGEQLALGTGGGMRVCSLAENTWTDEIHGGKGWVDTLDWSPDGKRVAFAADEGLYLWNGQEAVSPHGVSDRGGVLALDWHPNGSLLASGGSDGRIRLFDNNGRHESVIEGHSDAVRDVDWSPSGRHMASASSDRRVTVWTPDGMPVRQWDLYGVGTIAWAPDGTQLVANQFNRMFLLNFDPGQAYANDRPVVEEHTHHVRSLDWNSKDATIASGSEDGTIRLWAPDGSSLTLLRVLAESKTPVLRVAWSHDGKLLASASMGGNVWLWNLDDSSSLTLNAGAVWADPLAWSPDDTRLASGSFDGIIRIWQPDGTLREAIQGHAHWVNALAWSPDGTLLASAGQDNTIVLWNADTYQAETVTVVLDDGDWVTLGSDGTIPAW